MKLITELFDELEYITEASENGEKKMYIEGIFLQSAVKNRNGRIYPEEIMDKEVARYVKESVENNTALGELNHPNGPSINLDRVSHRIVSLKKEGTNYVGKALITNTPMGNIARGLMESGAKLGVSSRGMGTLKVNKAGINEVQKDFRLATAADIVSDPSAPQAWVAGIMENAEWVFDETLGWRVLEAIEEEKKDLESNYKQIDEARMLKSFQSFMGTIAKL